MLIVEQMNEILGLFARQVTDSLVEDVQKNIHYGVLMDESRDIANKEQVSINFRYVDDDLEIHEGFVGFYETANTDAETLLNVVKDALIRFNLPFSNLRGQCYDGASNMRGDETGLQTRIRGLENRALFAHCVAHGLNSTAQDAIKLIPLVRDTLSEVNELIVFIKASPKRENLYLHETDDSPPSTSKLRPLCPTRWTCRHKSLQSVIQNYSKILTFLEEFSKTEKDAKNAAKASGLYRYFDSTETYILVKFLYVLLGHVEIANTSMQKRSLHFRDTLNILESLKNIIDGIRNDEKFEQVWKECIDAAEKMDLAPLQEERIRRCNSRFEHYGSAATHFHQARRKNSKWCGMG